MCTANSALWLYSCSLGRSCQIPLKFAGEPQTKQTLTLVYTERLTDKQLIPPPAFVTQISVIRVSLQRGLWTGGEVSLYLIIWSKQRQIGKKLETMLASVLLHGIPGSSRDVDLRPGSWTRSCHSTLKPISCFHIASCREILRGRGRFLSNHCCFYWTRRHLRFGCRWLLAFQCPPEYNDHNKLHHVRRGPVCCQMVLK